jgi:hypothetical protein
MAVERRVPREKGRDVLNKDRRTSTTCHIPESEGRLQQNYQHFAKIGRHSLAVI